MRNYALITTAVGALLIGFTLSGSAMAQDALADTLPNAAKPAPAAAPASASPSTTLPSGSASTGASPSSGTPSATATGSSASASPSPVTGSASTVMPSSSSSSVIIPVTSTGSSSITGSANPLGGTGMGGGLTATPVMPSAVQDAVTRLQKVDQINLDDMIRAQDAINRLDLLLEIEKRQTELKKVRDERNKPAASSVAASLLGSAIPASALNLPKAAGAPPSFADTPAAPPSSSSFSSKSYSSKKSGDSDSSGSSSKYAIKRISGTDGRYFAVISTDDNSAQTVHPGDKLPDGSLVKSISLTNVSLFKEKKSKNLTIPTDSYIVRESGTTSQ